MPEDFIPQPHDLEQIVILLTLGAIDLTPTPETEFTFEQLMVAAQDYAGDAFVLEERDVRIVGISWLVKKTPRGTYRMR